MRNRFMIMPHDNRDIGYRRDSFNNLCHYFRTNQNARLAMSHCGVIELKDALREDNGLAYCEACEQIENIRKEMDGKNEPNL